MSGSRALIAAAVLAVTLVLAAPPNAAAGSDVERTIHVPEGWEGAYDFGYAPVVRVGDMVIVSGVPAGGDGRYEEKVRGMYRRVEELLAAAGASIDDVVELTTFHTTPRDSQQFWEEFERYMPIHREFFGEHRPAWTAVGTTVLLSGSASVEMRVVAVAGSGAASRVVRGAEAAAAPDAAPVAETARFAFWSDPEVNLHHFLYQWASAEAPLPRRWPPAVPERDELGALSPEERTAWTAAVEHYRAEVAARDPLFDPEMVALRDHLAGTAPAPSSEWARATLAALEQARPVYQARWWQAHDAANRHWVAALTPTLERVEVGLAERMAAAFGGEWPDGLVRVDVSAYSHDLGAYSTDSAAGPGPHVIITSLGEGYAMPYALEMVLHEAGHVDLLMHPLGDALAAAFAALGAEPPERHWHNVLFHTAGELTRQALAEIGVDDFVPYAKNFGLDRRRGAQADFEALEAHWTPYLRGDLSAEGARAAALAAVARALVTSPSSSPSAPPTPAAPAPPG
jgi:enamine deaminase RidA (YjgF/YER057c/UK114 family)